MGRHPAIRRGLSTGRPRMVLLHFSNHLPPIYLYLRTFARSLEAHVELLPGSV